MNKCSIREAALLVVNHPQPLALDIFEEARRIADRAGMSLSDEPMYVSPGFSDDFGFLFSPVGNVPTCSMED